MSGLDVEDEDEAVLDSENLGEEEEVD